MKKAMVQNGKIQVYNPKRVKEAKSYFLTELEKHRPEEPFTGAIALYVTWKFAHRKNDKNKDTVAKVTRPDLDNLQKLLKDCLTQCGYWLDDSQVVFEEAQKLRGVNPHLKIVIRELDVMTDKR